MNVAGTCQGAAPRRGGLYLRPILLDTLALGVIIPILPKLVGGFVDNDTASAAKIFGVFGTPWAVMQFFFSPILGGLSDRFGRRPCCCLISGWAGYAPLASLLRIKLTAGATSAIQTPFFHWRLLRAKNQHRR